MTRRVDAGAAVLIPVAFALATSGCSDVRPLPTTPTLVSFAPTAPVVPLPQASGFTLSGIVFETTSRGAVPVSGAELEIAVCPALNRSATAHVKTATDATGFYTVSDMCSGVTYVWVAKEGFRTDPPRQCDGDCLHADIGGNTRFDIMLIREP